MYAREDLRRDSARRDSGSPEVVAEPEGSSFLQDVGRHAPSTLTPSSLVALQRSVGNAAVARVVKADSPGEPPPGAAGEQPEQQQAGAEAKGEVVSGTIEPLEGEEITTRGCDADGHPYAQSRPAVAAAKPAASAGLHVHAHLTFEGRVHRDTALDGKADAVAGRLSLGNKITEGGASPGGGEFGVEKVKYKIDSTTWTADTAKKIVDISSRVFLDIGWGVHSLGRTNVSGAADAAVTKDNWSDMVTDLTPDGTGRPTRAWYGGGGEDRAYADGQASYQARADALSKRATDEKW